jgi:hypothetical protein
MADVSANPTAEELAAVVAALLARGGTAEESPYERWRRGRTGALRKTQTPTGKGVDRCR